jgi:TatA/E family protein of Tat protein translocase
MFGIGIQEFGVILVIALLVFGPKRLPELARMLGRGMGEFRRASHDLRQSLALDDLQHDLRRDLRSAQTALKPDSLLKTASRTDPADERPAQAGDGVEAAVAAASTAGASRPPEEGSTYRSKPAPDVHQGELPLGNDHEHHPDPDSEAQSAPDAGSASDADVDVDVETGQATDQARARGVADSERG